MPKKTISLCCALGSLVLAALPNGVAMTFAQNPSERLIKCYSYFSMMPLGYGNPFPILTVISTAAACVLILISILFNKKTNVKKAALVCLALCNAFSLLSWLIFKSFTPAAAFVTALHSAAFLLLCNHMQNKNKGDTNWTI